MMCCVFANDGLYVSSRVWCTMVSYGLWKSLYVYEWTVCINGLYRSLCEQNGLALLE